MTKILLVETASPKRIRRKAERILAGGIYPEPKITILCKPDPKTLQYLRQIPDSEVISLISKERRRVRREINGRGFDVLNVFWTGEKKYRRMKLFALGIRSKRTDVDIGDGSVFRLTWKACIRHAQFRWQHALPTDHHELVVPPPVGEGEECCEGEKILIVQSAEAPYVMRALDLMKLRPLFSDPHYTIFCRNKPEILKHFSHHPMLSSVRTHSETQGSWKHLRTLRRQQFDAVVVFFAGDPSYWKIKYFAFLLGTSRILIFNENNDCFFFSVRGWLALLSHRLGERASVGGPPRWMYSFRILLFLLLKCAILPFRFLWLLLVWVRLRRAGLTTVGL